MVVNKRKKNSRHRGSWTHGWGEKKKHRSAGSRGGVGMAGTGKRADTNKPSIQESPKYFGKWGFIRPVNVEKINSINVSTLESNLSTFVSAGIAKKEGSSYVVDLTKSSYNKLLGSGDINTPVKVTVKYAAGQALDKINKAGGALTVLVEKSSKKDKKKAKTE